MDAVIGFALSPDARRVLAGSPELARFDALSPEERERFRQYAAARVACWLRGVIRQAPEIVGLVQCELWDAAAALAGVSARDLQCAIQIVWLNAVVVNRVM